MSAVLSEPLNLGDLLKYEAPNLYSRDRVTVASGQNLPLGTVVGVVTATGKVTQIDPSSTDGTQVAAGVLLQACDATLADRDDGLIVARHAIVADHALAWPEAITNAEKLTAIAQLKALGVLVRQGA
ncbi:head decoration protein [Xanthomonas euvesicatoria]|uniref:head decoration protein n=1 Tax=Xanthomonas euvesicatoria TaxID=456327 RepID=UPI001C442DB1|nr:head decoration protein [Xanthomonas euvesicatoria]MBV6795029.1 head decoration protein [Xanthomonas campestris pv. daturae]